MDQSINVGGGSATARRREHVGTVDLGEFGTWICHKAPVLVISGAPGFACESGRLTGQLPADQNRQPSFPLLLASHSVEVRLDRRLADAPSPSMPPTSATGESASRVASAATVPAV